MIIYGKQPFFYVLEKHPTMIRKVYLAKDVEPKIFSKILKLGVKIEKLDNKRAQALAHGGNHQGFFVEVEHFKPLEDRAYVKDEFILILSGITDVGNIGSIVRTAYALGVDSIVIHGLKDPKYSAIARSSSGALFDTRLYVKNNLYDFLNELKTNDFTVYSATLEGTDTRELSISGKRVLMLGSESTGLPNRAIKASDKEVTIAFNREFDSLNVANAAAILIDRMR